MKILSQVIELYLLDGIRTHDTSTHYFYGELATIIAHYGENMIIIDLGIPKQLEIVVSFFAKVQRIGANKKYFNDFRDFYASRRRIWS